MLKQTIFLIPFSPLTSLYTNISSFLSRWRFVLLDPSMTHLLHALSNTDPPDLSPLTPNVIPPPPSPFSDRTDTSKSAHSSWRSATLYPMAFRVIQSSAESPPLSSASI